MNNKMNEHCLAVMLASSSKVTRITMETTKRKVLEGRYNLTQWPVVWGEPVDITVVHEDTMKLLTKRI